MDSVKHELPHAGRVAETLGLAVVLLAQAAREMRLAAPAGFAMNGLLHTRDSTPRFVVMRIAQAFGFDAAAAVTVRDWQRPLWSAPVWIGVAVAQMVRLIRAQFQVLRSVVLLVVVFMVDHFAPLKRSAQHALHHETMFADIASRLRGFIAYKNPHVALPVYVPAALPRSRRWTARVRVRVALFATQDADSGGVTGLRGRPPFLPFRRAAFALASDVTLPPLRPRATACGFLLIGHSPQQSGSRP